MLPTHRVEIHKELDNEEWTNDYLIVAADMDDAVDVAAAIVAFEQTFHYAVVTFTYNRVSTITPGDRIFRHVAINEPGGASIGTSHWLPLYCTVRVDLNTENSDPARKYYRLPLVEQDQQNGVLGSAFVASMNNLILMELIGSVAGDNIFTPKGNQVIGGTCYPYVQERQLHRRRKKKVLV